MHQESAQKMGNRSQNDKTSLNDSNTDHTVPPATETLETRSILKRLRPEQHIHQLFENILSGTSVLKDLKKCDQKHLESSFGIPDWKLCVHNAYTIISAFFLISSFPFVLFPAYPFFPHLRCIDSVVRGLYCK